MSLPTTYNLLARYPNPVYVETGIWRGDSIQQALDAGFNRVIGIDNDPGCIEFCKSRFDNNPAIELLCGESPQCLADVIKGIYEPITFLLDAHWQFIEGTDPGPNPFPLLDEIRAIGKRRQLDTIIIDDWHIFYEDRVGYGKINIDATLDDYGYARLEHVANPVIDGILIATRC